MNYPALFDFSGKSAVITGAASGIGLEAAKALARCGARLELIDLNKEPLDHLAINLRSEGIIVGTKVLDVRDEPAVADAVKAIVADAGAPDILVNSAGVARLHSVLDIEPDAWKNILDININGTFWPSQHVGKAMVAAGKGSIINLGSMSGTIINKPQFASSYMVAKGAVHQLTKALAVEWAKTGVRVNALAPGYVGTEMTLAMRERPELFDTWMEMTPMGRCGTPQEIAAAILFLASDASSYMTGSIVPIDGGYTAL